MADRVTVQIEVSAYVAERLDRLRQELGARSIAEALMLLLDRLDRERRRQRERDVCRLAYFWEPE